MKFGIWNTIHTLSSGRFIKIIKLLKSNNYFIEAIYLIRLVTGWGLTCSKKYYDTKLDKFEKYRVERMERLIEKIKKYEEL